MDYIGTILQKNNLDDKHYAEIAIWCNETQSAYIADKGTYYEVERIEEPADSELRRQEIETELSTLKGWLSAHDYIGIKIATGRASASDYADIIEEMKAKADRINELEAELASLS